MNKIIDCHTHLQTKELIDEYFEKRKGYAISIKALDSLIGNGDDFYKATKDYKNIFICECIDALEDINPQLKQIKENLKKYRIVGIKIYLGYQPIFADDEKLFPVYDFAKKYGLSVLFHCGVGAQELESYSEENSSSSIPVGKIAKLYPTVNFIASHFDSPNLQDCAKVVMENENVFTDISGEYENLNNLSYKELMNIYFDHMIPIIKLYGKNNLAKKVMFGTDYFGKGSGFDAIEEYIETIKILFGKENIEDCLYNNCLKAYPKIKDYINENYENQTL